MLRKIECYEQSGGLKEGFVGVSLQDLQNLQAEILDTLKSMRKLSSSVPPATKGRNEHLKKISDLSKKISSQI